MQTPIPLTSNTTEKGITGGQELVNLYPRITSQGKYPFKLIGTPGTANFCELPTFPVKELRKAKGRAFAFTPSAIYEIFQNNTFQELAQVSLNGIRLSIANNGLQVVVVDGIKGYSIDLSSNEVVEIIQDGFYPSTNVIYQDGYFIFNRVGTGQFYLSELLDVAFDPNDFGSAEAQPDKLVSIISDHRELFLFGEETIEVWYNSGDAALPFERNQGAYIEKGCAAPYSVSKANNTIYFIGSDRMVYSLNGYTPIRVSNHEVESTLSNAELSEAFSYTYQEQGHLFYVLTIPSKNKTWCYDISTGSWHIRKSYQFERHVSNCKVEVFNKNLVGSFNSGVIYELNSRYYRDDLEPLIRELTLPTISNGRSLFSIAGLELDMSSGVGLTNGDGFDPELRIFTSKDGGKSFLQHSKVVPIGKEGEFLTRAKATRFGVGRQFTFRVEISDPIPVEIGGAWLEQG